MNTFLLVSAANLVQVMSFYPAYLTVCIALLFIIQGASGTITQPSNGLCARDDVNITYTPNSNFCGVDQFTYTITHPTGVADTATVTVAVVCPETTKSDRPIANDDFATTNQGKSVVLFVLSNDTVPPGKMM
jgi:hypothetical protein